jgi:hypothetical protein
VLVMVVVIGRGVELTIMCGLGLLDTTFGKSSLWRLLFAL